MADEATPAIEPEPTPVDPAVAAVDPAIEPPAPDPEPPEPDPTPSKQHGNAGRSPWYMQRIADETAKRHAEAQAREAAERRARDAEALLARLQSKDAPAGSPAPTPAMPAPDDQSRQAEIAREAARQRFYEDTVEIKNKGMSQFGVAFNESLNILNALGATTDDFVNDVLAVDKANAHVILDTIAKDPERTAVLASMNSRQRIAELTRMTMANPTTPTPAAPSAKAPAAPAKTVSKAPAPPPPVQPSASKTVDWRTDEASDEDFSRGFDDMLRKRGASRR